MDPMTFKQLLLYLLLFGDVPCSNEHHFCDATPVPYTQFVQHREGEDRAPGDGAVSAPAAPEPGRCAR